MIIRTASPRLDHRGSTRLIAQSGRKLRRSGGDLAQVQTSKHLWTLALLVRLPTFIAGLRKGHI